MAIAVPSPVMKDSSTSAMNAHETSLKAPISSFIGTSIEWYDYFIYGTAAALVFPKVFFSSLSPTMASLASLASFSVAFVLRPIGGLVFGHFGDRLGRRSMLVLTLVLMSLCTAAIGILPAYSQIGDLAPVALLICRMLQGFAVGGEWGGAALMAVEHAPADRRGFYGSLMQMGVPAGLLLSTAAFSVASLLPDESFYAWGWRIPFLLSLLLLGVGLYIRLRVAETPQFVDLSRTGSIAKVPLTEVFRNEKYKTFVMVFLQSAMNVGYFLITVYGLTYVSQVLHLPRQWATTGLLIGATVDLALQPIFGWLSDRLGRKVVFAFGVLFFAAFAFPFFQLLETGSEGAVWLAMILGLGVGHASTGSLISSIYAEQYPARYRYSGASLAYQTSGIVSSAPTPLIAAWLVATTGSSTSVAWYVIGAAVISLVCLFLIRETARDALDLSHDR